MTKKLKYHLYAGLLIATGFVGVSVSSIAQESPAPQENPTPKGEVVSPEDSTSLSVSEPAEVVEPSVYFENFNGDDRSTMLGGQIDFSFNSKWIVTTGDGKFIMENRADPNVLHWDDIKWVRYEGEEVLSSTRRARISVSVEAMNEGRGGVGILVGSGEHGGYLVFGVDKDGRYHVMERNGRKATRAFSGVDKAIRAGQSNRLSFEWRDDQVVFLANGTEVIQLPYDKRVEAGVGLAAFGLGIYTFDDVEITKVEFSE